MSRMPHSLRAIIARNIRECRLEKFPKRGGSKECAEEFSLYTGRNVSPQQWSPWECGGRTPNEESLEQIAAFFGKTVEYMHCDNSPPPVPPMTSMPPYEPPCPSYAGLSAPELIMAMDRKKLCMRWRFPWRRCGLCHGQPDVC